ncbi:class I SAM-dependent methyltransferase [Pseudomonas sp. CGJS7]|uniref:class I SAM-dependent methyltransferase n=1 Tax=Pseudomonas sp. CGJS7 TaxID=3109348 RepID=UPI0030087789
MAKQEADQFDRLGALYEDMATWPFRKWIETPSVKRAVGDVDSLDVVDFGCGSGFYSRLLKAAGANRVLGYDLAEGMLGYARNTARIENVEIEFRSALTPSDRGAFDLVLAVYVLPYATSRAELASMCADMMAPLRSGGRLVALPIHPNFDPEPAYYQACGFTLTPDRPDRPHQDGGRLLLDLRYRQHIASVHAWYWSAESIESALRSAGAESVEWTLPGLDDRVDVSQVPAELQAYLDRPHAAIVECVKA